MNNDPLTHGLWERTAPPAPNTDILSDDLYADVVVVGAGYTGLSAALKIGTAGRSCVVLEAEEIGFGGSGRNVGLVNAGLWLQPADVHKALGQPYGDRILSLLDQAPSVVYDLIARHGISCEASRPGTLHCGVGAAGDRQLREREHQWRGFGADVVLLDRDETTALTGSKRYSSALLDRRAGTIQPLAYARGLADAALAAGAHIFTKSAVRSTTRQTDGSWRLTTQNGSVTARWVIVATNAYTVSPWSNLRTELVPLPYFNIATTPLPPAIRQSVLPQGHGIWDTKEILTSARMDQAGRLVIGSVGALRHGGAAIHEAWAKRAMHRLFPQTRNIPFESAWWGTIGMTPDHVPRFHCMADRIVTMCGYNGRGIGPGTVFGIALAELALGTRALSQMPLACQPVHPITGRTIREAVYELGSAASHLITDRF